LRNSSAGSDDDVDAALLRAHARGDPRAFADLLERYRHRIMHLVRCRIGARDPWAEDVAQDVFVQVHRKAGTFEGRSSVKTWLFSVAINVCREHQRRERRASATAPPRDGDEPLLEVPDGALGPLEQLERDERAALVREALEELGPTHRTVLFLRDHEDMTYEQIAAALGVPVGTVRSRLHNGRALLAEALARRARTVRGLAR
jgi:RNA polymerase sigma-70 factor (ECF subfamily)